MSRRKQQNPKPLKYDEGSTSELLTEPSGGVGGETALLAVAGDPTSHYTTEEEVEPQPTVTIKHEPQSPEQTVDPASPAGSAGVSVSPALPPLVTTADVSLESLLGVPDDAPLKVQRCLNGGYKILSAKHITKGAGLDPLRAQKLEVAEDSSLMKDNPKVVSFLYSHSEEKVHFMLESSINCGWLKYLGDPDTKEQANLRIYYVGGQLWVEVIKNLSEGEQLIAEFCEPSKTQYETSTNDDSGQVKGSSSPKPITQARKSLTEGLTVEATQFPCALCGIQFRNPNTLMAHKKHYCSKLPPTSAANAADHESRSPLSSGGSGESKEVPDNLQQSAYMCVVCKFMSLTKADMKSHVKEKHSSLKLDAESATSSSNIPGLISNADKTFCEDCEIHFKKPESYQAHKQHYCKNRTNTQSPRSENGALNQSISSKSTSPVSPSAKEMYKKVSVFDNQALSASLATQAAAAMAAASLPFTLSSMLSLPGMATLPMMPQLKMFQSPALFAQAMQSVAKASGGPATSAASAGVSHREETPLDLTVKQELLNSGAVKRKAMSEQGSPPMKVNKSSSKPASPAPPTLSRSLNGQVKPLKPERPIYRCERCSIPFYKKDVYEAHRLHYCSRRPSSGSEKDEEITTPSRVAANPEQQSPPEPPADDRLVITYTCNKCSTSYRTIETFKAHQCVVPQASPPLLHCEECNFSTQSSRILAEHAETHQKVNVVYKCKLCGYHGNTLRGMRQHGRQHMLKGEDFNDNDVDIMEVPLLTQRLSLPALVIPAPYSNDVDEELLRLKNEPYKKRRSRKHYQKSECMSVQISPQRKENGLRAGSSSPHSASTASCTSPLQQISTMNVPPNDKSSCASPSAVAVKHEPTDIVIDVDNVVRRSPEHRASPPDKTTTPVKAHICLCNASFASISTFEAHKKLYCSHHKAQRSTPTITVNH